MVEKNNNHNQSSVPITESVNQAVLDLINFGQYEKMRVIMLDLDPATLKGVIGRINISDIFNMKVSSIENLMKTRNIPESNKEQSLSVLSALKLDDKSNLDYYHCLPLVQPFRFSDGKDTKLIKDYADLYAMIEMSGLTIESFQEYINVTDKDGQRYRFFSNGCCVCLTPIGQLFDLGNMCVRIIEPALLSSLYSDAYTVLDIPRPNIHDFNTASLVLKTALSFLSNDVGIGASLISLNPLLRTCYANRAVMRCLTRSSCSVINSDDTYLLHVMFVIQLIKSLRDKKDMGSIHTRESVYKSFKHFIKEV